MSTTSASSKILVRTSKKFSLTSDRVPTLWLSKAAPNDCRSQYSTINRHHNSYVLVNRSHRSFYPKESVILCVANRSTVAATGMLNATNGTTAIMSNATTKTKTERKTSVNAGPPNHQPPSLTFGQKCVLATFSALTTLYDIATLPIYTAIDQPWKKIRLSKSQKSLPVDGEPSTFRALIPKAPIHQEMLDYNIKTIPQLYKRAVEKHDSKPCLGTRVLLNEPKSVYDPLNMKYVKKYELGDYTWRTYRDVFVIVNQITAGLDRVLNLKPKDKIAIFAETREEWFMLAMAAFRKNLTIVTVFTTLANEGVVHALSETDVTTLVTSEEQMPRVKEVLARLPNLKTIVCFEEHKLNKRVETEKPNLPDNISFHWYNELLNFGGQDIANGQGPTEDDLAIIMYTSGSTGTPKGVMLSHKNVISGLHATMDSCHVYGTAQPDDAYIAYLPLAHVLELTSEAMSFIQGVRIGYSSANTLVDNAIGLEENTKGDCFILKPTVLPSVPLVLERVAKGINEKLSHRPRMIQLLFDYFYNYKIRWMSYGFETPLVNNIIFRKARATFGGRIRFIVCGGAPLSSKTQEFIRTVLSCPVGLGYGMTETTSAAMITLAYDKQVGRTGSPITCNKIRLVDWEEGGYRVSDKPNPRGELWIGGDNVALGYFKRMDEDTFFTDSEGTRWVRTGDIAEIHPDNVFAIIDRKTDLIKLSNGEFISLGKIESTLKSCSIVENICVYANTTTSHIVALIVPDPKKLAKLADSLGMKMDSNNAEAICENKALENAILQQIQQEGKEMKLLNIEIPRQIRLCPTPWTPDSGLVTGSLKLKRSHIYKEFDVKLKEMYSF